MYQQNAFINTILNFSWNEWITLPHQFNDLPRTAMLTITILDCAGAGNTTIIGGTTISLFGKNGMFRQGMFDLRVWADVEADGNFHTTTPGKIKDSSKNQMQRLAKLAKKHRNGQIPKVDWLDRLTFREIEMINEKEKTESDYLFLLIEFPMVICDQTDQSVCKLLLYYYDACDSNDFFFLHSIQLFTSSLMASKHTPLYQNQRLSLCRTQKYYR